MMDEVVKILKEEGFYNIEKVVSFDGDKHYQLRFIEDRTSIDMALSVASLNGNMNTDYVRYSDDRHLFYILLKEMEPLTRVTLLNNICKELGQYDIMVALNIHSSETVISYAKDMITLMFVSGNNLQDHIDVYKAKCKPTYERNMLAAICKRLTVKCK